MFSYLHRAGKRDFVYLNLLLITFTLVFQIDFHDDVETACHSTSLSSSSTVAGTLSCSATALTLISGLASTMILASMAAS